MRDYLKVKCLSLGDEAKLIRRLENVHLKQAIAARVHKPQSVEYHEIVYRGMHQHRVVDIRREARLANIAYGFLKGREYGEIEAMPYKEPNWTRIEELVLRFGEGDVQALRSRFRMWMERARGVDIKVAAAR